MYVDTVDPRSMRNNTFNSMHVEISRYMYMYCVFLAIHQIAAGHRVVAEGWTLFEKTCEEVGPGELPQLLRQLKSATTPTPTPTPGTTTPTKKRESGKVPMEADADDIEV